MKSFPGPWSTFSDHEADPFRFILNLDSSSEEHIPNESK